MNRQEMLRYERHLLLPEVGDAGQKKLKEASVLIVGAGGLGSPMALYLAAAGIGHIGIIDFDQVSESNLQRQVLYSTVEVGRPKVEAARDRLLALNPFIEVTIYQERLGVENALGIFSGYQIIADGADNFSTRYLVNDAAVLSGKPLISASIVGFEGQLSVFNLDGGPCYRCLYPEPPPEGTVLSCTENGVIGVLPGVMGSLQATEVIKLILGIGEALHSHLLQFDALSMEFRKFKIRRNSACAACGDQPTIKELKETVQACGIGAPELDCAALRAELGNKKLLLLDVRELQELESGFLPGSVHIPLGELSARLDEIKSEKVVVYCRSGVRSRSAASLLREKGFVAWSLKGGHLAWLASGEQE